MFWLGLSTFLLLGFLFFAGIFGYGIRRSLGPLIIAAACSGGIYIAERDLTVSSVAFDSFSFFCGALGGGLLGAKSRPRALPDKPNFAMMARSRLMGWLVEPRVRVLAFCLVFGIVITGWFGKLSSDENQHKFWHGFYEAWTASIVFFGTIGVASLFFAFYRPEREAFSTRVKILCGGKEGIEVKYIMIAIRDLGYYAEHVERVINIKKYETVSKSFFVESSVTSLNKNFYDDAGRDKLKMRLAVDPLDPPQKDVGKLLSVVVGDKSLCDVTPFDAEHPFIGEWDIEIPKLGSQTVNIRHDWYLRTDKTHVISSSRFVKHNTVTFRHEGFGVDVLLSYTEYKHILPRNADGQTIIEALPEKAVSLKPGKSHTINFTTGSVPTETFLSYTIQKA